MTVFNTQGAAVGSSQFVRARIGYCTASRVKDVLDFKKNGEPGAARTKYLFEVVAERRCDAAMDHYVSPDMEHGLEYEQEAKLVYAERTGFKLQEAEFIEHPRIEFFGATPDALIGDDGLAEFKCPRTTTFLAWQVAGTVPEIHKPQMIAQLMCTERDWCDFAAYDPRIKDERGRMFVRRFVPTDAEINAVEVAVRQFLAEVDELFEKVTTECL